MPPLAIDHVSVATADLEAAAAPWRRLGLTVAAGTRHAGAGTESAVAMFGDSPERMCFIEFLMVHDRAQASATARGRRLLAAIDAGGGVFRCVLDVDAAAPFVAAAAAAGGTAEVTPVRRADGSAIGDAVAFGGDAETSNEPRLIAHARPRAERFAARRARGAFASTFALRRLDHLALVPRDMAASTRWWHDVLGVGVHGEVRAGGLYIRQFRVGDGMVEFLGPNTPDSPIARAAPGLRSMLACEVADLDAAVATARARGFSPSVPGPGALPGTRTATIPARELGGVALQLLAYAPA